MQRATLCLLLVLYNLSSGDCVPNKNLSRRWILKFAVVVKRDEIPPGVFFTHFLDCIKTRNQPITNGNEGLRVLKVLDACEASLKSNQASGNQSPAPSIGSSGNQFFSHPTACIDDGCTIGDGTKIWHFSHIMKDAQIGQNCIFGRPRSPPVTGSGEAHPKRKA